MLFWRAEPWGPYRDNVHAGLIAATLANAFRGKGGRAITYDDFMLVDAFEHKRRKSKETVAWMKAVAKRK